jgi:hypothetical protein
MANGILPEESFLRCFEFELRLFGVLESAAKSLIGTISAVSEALCKPFKEFLLKGPEGGGLIENYFPDILSLPKEMTGDLVSLALNILDSFDTRVDISSLRFNWTRFTSEFLSY